jgi:hypothetical protein
MMPFLRSSAPPHRTHRTLVTGGLVVAQAMVALTLVALVGPADGSQPRAARDTAKPVAEAAALRRLAAPRQLSPAPGATVKAVPSFAWARVPGAIKYEFQLAADDDFRSSVLGQRRTSLFTANLFASIDRALSDGSYFWRVRAIDKRSRAGRWTKARSFKKEWGQPPTLLAPVAGAPVAYPGESLLMRWTPVPRAYKYRVEIATDPALANSALPRGIPSIETSGTSFVLAVPLAPDKYYWAITPLDADKHYGQRSEIREFTWHWPSKLNEATQMSFEDLDGSDEVFDPQLNWAPIPGAARYEVEISMAVSDGQADNSFPAGSIVCCSDAVTGTSLTPAKLLPNNTGGDPGQPGYRWRVRGLDPDGNAGAWNYGPPFDQRYPASIKGLHLRDNLGDTPTDRNPTTPELVDTWAPAIVWNQVPGASSYEVQVVPYVQVPGTSVSVCNWSASSGAWNVVTAATGWTPLGNPAAHKPSGVLTNLVPSKDTAAQPSPGTAYCARVKARRDRDAKNKEVVSDWTTIHGGARPAFRYVEPPAPSGATLAMSAGDYVEPVGAPLRSWMPLLAWKPVDGARGYFVVVARDEQFTKIVDLAFTNVPVYAPRRDRLPWTYPDETNSYWWAVVPTAAANGDIAPTPPTGNAPQRFLKQSTRPVAMRPTGGEKVVSLQPTFRWSPTLGARSYTLEVAQDQSFSDPILSVVTASSAYTPTATLPADATLYWRVRANDETGIGLSWSDTAQFWRALPHAEPALDNPFAGDAIPVLSWAPVQGAVSYDIHFEQADGTKRTFALRSTAFTPVGFYGTGVWSWQVRPNFKFGTTVVAGAYSQPMWQYARRIASPNGERTTTSGKAALLAWQPAVMARKYRVELSDTDSFTKVLERVTTANTNYAPRMIHPAFHSGAPLFWRVASIDEGNNLGAWVTNHIRRSKPMRLRLRGSLRKGRTRTVRATVKDSRGRAIRRAKVSVTGAGIRVTARHTTRRGKVSFRLSPKVKGRVVFLAEKRGFATSSKRLSVR